ncbi:MAG TPA: recombinase family protein [Candidatus Angelobacter sp.]|nr:recombinase family protein [Candidatus Angelobacter sp.]
MPRVERIRESVTGPVDAEHMRQKAEAGWRLVALEWQRETQGEDGESETLIQEVPYGLRVAHDCLHLVEDPDEKSALVMMMELIVRDDPFSQVASELNERGFRTRNGSAWTPVSVFNMLPRLIEVGPRIFSSEEWEARKERLMRTM